jgi:plasmid maintenance system antidote protein VapI
VTETNYAVAPGEFLQEWVDENALPLEEVARRMGCSHSVVVEIITGRAPVTDGTARKLECLTGIPARVWLRYESAYQCDLARITQQRPAEAP